MQQLSYQKITKFWKCQFLIGNVYPIHIIGDYDVDGMCQFLIGNVYLYVYYLTRICIECQFLIGNVYRILALTQ